LGTVFDDIHEVIDGKLICNVLKMFLFPFERFGGNGFNTEYSVEKLFCNAKILFEETNVTVMFIHISCCVLYEQREAGLAWRRRKVRLKLPLIQGQSICQLYSPSQGENQ
jgi:hypothetical protein